MKKQICLFFMIFLFQAFFATDKVKNSMVKIYSTHQQYDYRSPWQNGYDYSSTATGFIISGNRILTNAHAVISNRFLQVRKEGDAKKYKASVEFISEKYDLAVLTVEEKDFFRNASFLEFGDLPNIRDKVAIYGYPLGGDKLSTTEGIVSRIEHSRYTMTTERFLIGQTDAAINPGNSGGPVVSKGKVVGVSFSGLMGADNIGYFIPTTVIKHFLNDIKDKIYDGPPKTGIIWSELESPSYRKMLGVEDTSNGVLIKKIQKNSPFEEILKEGDVLLKLDSYPVEYDGSIEFRKGERTDFEYIIQNKNFGDTVKYEIIRDKKRIYGEAVLSKNKIPSNKIKDVSMEQPPTYFIYGGLVFEPLSDQYINNSSINFLTNIEFINELEDKQEIVVLVRVLSDDLNIGYANYNDEIIISVNGRDYKDFRDFVKIVKELDSDYIKFKDLNGNEIVLERKLAEERNPIIFQNYNIEKDVSKDMEEK